MAVALDTQAEFPTPEHIAFTHRVVGPLSRVLAWLIDLTLRVMLLTVVWIGLAMFGVVVSGAFFALAILITFVVNWLLAGLIEWRWRGFTPGKRLLGIRVIGVDGLPAGLAPCMLRNLLRVADLLFPSPLTGLIAMLVSGRGQRLGDMVAGTLVVHAQRRYAEPPMPPADKTVVDLARQLPSDIAVHIDGHVLKALQTFVVRRRAFSPGRRREIAEPLALPLLRRCGMALTTDPDRMLCAVLERLRAAGDGAGALAGRVAARMDRRRGDWEKLESWASNGRRMRGDQPAAMLESSLLRSASTDLALADAYHLSARTVDHLQQVVGSAHQRFYHAPVVELRRWWRMMSVDVPNQIRGDWCLWAAIAAFFGTFLIGMAIGFADPQIATAYVGEETISQMHEMYAKAPHDREFGTASAMTGFYVSNNVGIALMSFAVGIFAGIGALAILAANGAYIGLIFGYMIGYGGELRDHFLEFVSAHGPFELFGITMCGAAGMRLGLALLRPGPLTRIAALRQGALRAAPILGVAALLVAMAAPIEAFVSPSGLPLAAKRAVMVVCIIMVVVYITLLGRGQTARIAWTPLTPRTPLMLLTPQASLAPPTPAVERA